MNFLQLAKARYSLRKYSDKPVEPEKIDAIMAAASLAPTGCNNQPQRILIVDDPAILDKIRRCTAYQFGAPVTLLVCYDKKACW
ncbi:MAG: nitroreductase family protein, partial [Victivallales bacterium]|nr:nitroreductase family protein [Victivallales bacterium]